MNYPINSHNSTCDFHCYDCQIKPCFVGKKNMKDTQVFSEYPEKEIKQNKLFSDFVKDKNKPKRGNKDGCVKT